MVRTRLVGVSSLAAIPRKTLWHRTARHAVALLLACVAAACLGPSASAVIITGGDGSGNTSAPSPDPGWDHVGLRGVGTAIYLGNRWVLTADHVGSGSVTFGSTTYSLVSGSEVRLLNADTTPTDLLMFRISSDPGMSALAISSTAAAHNWAITMIGDGLDRATDLTPTTWYVDTTPNPYVWAEAPFPGWDATADGYKWGSNRTQRWGTNVISTANVLQSNYDYGDVSGFQATFDFGVTGGNEAIAANGDSGGAVFHDDGTSWKLAGVILLRYTYSGQPSSTSVFGNETFAADLSVYRDQIVSLVPEPATLSLLAIGGLMLFRRAAGRRRSRASDL